MEPTAHQLLRTIPLFAKLSDEHVAALAALAKPEHYHRLAQIVRQGDLGNRFFLIANGAVSLRRTTASGAESPVGAVVALSSQLEGQVRLPNYFGEQMFSSQEQFDFHADAVTEVDVWSIQRSDFDDLLRTHRHILHALEFIRAAERRRRKGLDRVSEGEAVTLVVRKHWWGLAKALLPLIVPIAIAPFIPLALRYFSYTQYEFAGAAVPALLIVIAILFQIVDWYNDEYVVTNQRVAHVERNFFLQQELRDGALIDQVQGVTIERSGLTSLLFGVARLVIQTPGREEGNVVFDSIGNPEKVQAVIGQQIEKNRARRAAEMREQFRRTVSGELKQYIAPDLSAASEHLAPPAPKRRSWLAWLKPLMRLLGVLGSPLKIEFHFQDRVVWRKHWFLLFIRTREWFAWIIGILVVGGIIDRSIPNPGILIATGILCIGFGLRIIYEWMDWSNDTYAVTDTQIINSERKPFGLSEKTSTAPLDRITDVVADIPNVWGTIFRFGTLRIDTAGKEGQMIFESIHEPSEAQEEIFRRINEYKVRRAREDASVRSSSVVDAIVAYHRMQEEERRKAEANLAPPADADDDERDWDLPNTKLDPKNSD